MGVRAVWIPRYGKADVLEVREAPDPTPEKGSVRIRVEASGVNFAEIMARQGLYHDAPKPPMVVGYEVAGVIDAVGSGVNKRHEGQRVIAMTRFGGYADTLCVPSQQTFVMPNDMSFAEGAALPVNYLTAYHMLFEVFRLRPGDHVLIHQVAGGVGTAASQLCRSVEGVVTYGTASAHKHDYARAHGCTHPIDYRAVDYAERVRQLSGGRGVHLVLDALGGADWKKGFALLRPAGMLIPFGWANMTTAGSRRMTRVLKQFTHTPVWSPIKLMNENRGVAGVNMGHLWDHVDLITKEMEALQQLFAAGTIRPHIDGSYPFDQADEAHEQIEAGKNLGKVLLEARG